MKSTRDKILETLLSHPRSTIHELADSVAINSISARHHIASLQAEGLISTEEERHGVGRPRQVFFLTDKGLERFPTNYLRLASRLLTQLKQSLPAPLIGRLFDQMATEISSTAAEQTDQLSLEGKLNFIKEILTREGFSIDWEKKGDLYEIREIGCPYVGLGKTHPEVCNIDKTLISSVLNIPVEKISCLLHGDRSCTYSFSEES